MTDKNAAVLGLYSSRAALESAVDVLRAQGFQSADISVVSAQHPGAGTSSPASATDGAHEAPAGPGPVAAVGGALGWLVGVSALAVASGVFMVAGPIMEVLARIGAGKADVASGLSALGVPEAAARTYEGRILSGGALLSLHADDEELSNLGRTILEQTGAQGILSVSRPAPAPAGH